MENVGCGIQMAGFSKRPCDYIPGCITKDIFVLAMPENPTQLPILKEAEIGLISCVASITVLCIYREVNNPPKDLAPQMGLTLVPGVEVISWKPACLGLSKPVFGGIRVFQNWRHYGFHLSLVGGVRLGTVVGGAQSLGIRGGVKTRFRTRGASRRGAAGRYSKKNDWEKSLRDIHWVWTAGMEMLASVYFDGCRQYSDSSHLSVGWKW